jgi:hypothetical protein
MDSIANPHLNDDPGAIIAFPDESFGLKVIEQVYTTFQPSRGGVTGAVGW